MGTARRLGGHQRGPAFSIAFLWPVRLRRYNHYREENNKKLASRGQRKVIPTIHSFLIYPGKNEKAQHALHGVQITNTDARLFGMLRAIFDGAERECKIEIIFSSNNQQNDTRDDCISYIRHNSTSNAKKLAERLQVCTTKRSGLGLLFLMSGDSGSKRKLVLSRFPVEQGILADEAGGSLTVQFIDRIFMKNTSSYKSCLYTGTSFSSGFWSGLVVDKQVNSSDIDVSRYWISEFLASDFKTTSAAGTARLATVLRTSVNAAQAADTKRTLINVASAVRKLDGQYISIDDLCQRLLVSDEGMELIRRQIRNPRVLTEKFRFSNTEFRKQISYRSWETKEGVLVTADAENWEKTLSVEKIGGTDSRRVKISTEGTLVDERLRKGR